MGDVLTHILILKGEFVSIRRGIFFFAKTVDIIRTSTAPYGFSQPLSSSVVIFCLDSASPVYDRQCLLILRCQEGEKVDQKRMGILIQKKYQDKLMGSGWLSSRSYERLHDQTAISEIQRDHNGVRKRKLEDSSHAADDCTFRKKVTKHFWDGDYQPIIFLVQVWRELSYKLGWHPSSPLLFTDRLQEEFSTCHPCSGFKIHNNLSKWIFILFLTPPPPLFPPFLN